MKKYFLAILFIGILFFLHSRSVEAAGCLNFDHIDMSVPADEWPGGSISVSCPGGLEHITRQPGHIYCDGESKTLVNGGSVSLHNCNCLVSNKPIVSGLPPGCSWVNQSSCSGVNGDHINCTLQIECATPTPTATPIPTATPTTAPTQVPTTVPSNTPVPPACNVACVDDNTCPRPGSGLDCNHCLMGPLGYKVCSAAPTATPAPPSCGQQCPAAGVGSCPLNCPCNTTTNVCTAPTSTPAPTATPAVCQPGIQCTATGGECANGLCSNINPDTGIGSCNCQGGGCSTQPPNNVCGPRPGQIIPTPDASHRSCIDIPVGGQIAQCCRTDRGPWTIDRCTPAAATPTPIQPSQEITMIATPTLNPGRPTSTPIPGITNTPNTKLSQRWVCLQALPCSDPASGCSVASDHRVRISSKTAAGDSAKPLSGQYVDTYIFECLQTSTGNKCTTGDAALDQAAVGSSSLGDLQSTYGYSFGGMYYENGVDVAPNPIPPGENNNGNFGAREWESGGGSTANVNRLFMAMNNFDPNGVGGTIGAQQQGVLAFIQGGSKKCVQIRWDPYGQISDTWTLKPVANAQVFIYQKTNDQEYSLVTDSDVLGGIQNPITSDQSGAYNFNVPDGSYRIEVKAPGYKVYSKDIRQSAGKQEEHKVELTPTTESLFNKAKDYLLNLLSTNK